MESCCLKTYPYVSAENISYCLRDIGRGPKTCRARMCFKTINIRRNFHGKISLCLKLNFKYQFHKISDLEKENSNLKFEFDSKMIDQQAERYASLVEKNKNLTDWREQLIEKNRVLSEENRKLTERCSNLEELLNEEETDINVVLEMIQTMQMPPATGMF